MEAGSQLARVFTSIWRFGLDVVAISVAISTCIETGGINGVQFVGGLLGSQSTEMIYKRTMSMKSIATSLIKLCSQHAAITVRYAAGT